MQDINEWWKEQETRTPSAYHVWSVRKRTSVELLLATDKRPEAERMARIHRPARVVGPTPADGVFLNVTHRGERGPWAKPPPEPDAWVQYMAWARVLAAAPDGTKLASLGIPPHTAKLIALELLDGCLTWGRSRKQKVPKVQLSLVREGRGYVVRR